MLKKMTVTLLASILFCGCSTAASISRADGKPINGKILRSSSSAIIVETKTGSRSNISDIDHPGNGVAIIGGLLGAYGAFNITQGVPLCEENGPAFCGGVFLPAVVGGTMLIWGLSTWLGSTGAASMPSGSTTVPDAPQASAFDFSPATGSAGASAFQVR